MRVDEARCARCHVLHAHDIHFSAVLKRVAWAISRPEVAWLTCYFSFSVWVSLAFVHVP